VCVCVLSGERMWCASLKKVTRERIAVAYECGSMLPASQSMHCAVTQTMLLLSYTYSFKP